MGHEYTPTEEDRPAANASQAEDILELSLHTQEQGNGPIDLVNAKNHQQP